MEHKKINIVTVNLNNKDGLEKTIRSVIGQTFFDKLNYIIIDGGSTDGSTDVIEKYKDKLAFYISEKDKGVYHAMNKGIDHCDGEYVLFLNSGDYFHESNVIEEVYDELDKEIVYGALNVHAKDKEFIIGNYEYDIERGLPHPATFVKLDLMKENKFNEDYKIISDWIFFYEQIYLKHVKYKRVKTLISDFFLDGLSSDFNACKKEKEKYFKSCDDYNGLISVVIPCYNQAKYVRDTIISVKASRYKDFCCIIVNDGSTDNSEEVILDEIKGDKRFKYYKIKNGGLGHARNFGISKTNSKYILCLDSDDLISPYYIKKGVEFLEKNKNFSLFYANANFLYDEDGEEKKWNLPPYCYKSLLTGNMIYCSHIFRRSEYNKTRGYDEEMYGFQDWEFLVQLLNNRSNVYRDDETMFYYRRHKDSMDYEVKDKKMRYLLYIYEKNKEKFHENNLEVRVR